MVLDLVIRGCYLIGVEEPKDVGIENSHIVEVSDQIEESGQEEINAKCCLVSPGFIDSHMHMDKALIGEGRRYPRYNSETGAELSRWMITRSEIIDIGRKLYRDFTVEDIRRRAVRLCKMAVGQGITSIRTHVDVDTSTGVKGIEGLNLAKQDLKDLIDIQVVAFAQSGFLTDPGADNIVKHALELGADLVGGIDPADREHNIQKALDIIFEIASDYKVGIDQHLHTRGNLGLYVIDQLIDKTIETRFQGRVNASHAFCLADASDQELDLIIPRLKEAKINIVSCYSSILPNMPIRQLLKSGVNIATGADGVRDHWLALGNADMLLGAHIISYKCGLKTNEALREIYDMTTVEGAKTLGIIDEYGVAKGKKADLVILDAQSPQWAIIKQPTKLYTIKNGKIVAKNGKVIEL